MEIEMFDRVLEKIPTTFAACNDYKEFPELNVDKCATDDFSQKAFQKLDIYCSFYNDIQKTITKNLEMYKQLRKCNPLNRKYFVSN